MSSFSVQTFFRSQPGIGARFGHAKMMALVTESTKPFFFRLNKMQFGNSGHPREPALPRPRRRAGMAQSAPVAGTRRLGDFGSPPEGCPTSPTLRLGAVLDCAQPRRLVLDCAQPRRLWLCTAGEVLAELCKRALHPWDCTQVRLRHMTLRFAAHMSESSVQDE